MISFAKRESVAKIEAKTGVRRVKHADRFGVPGERVVNVVEIWVDGVCFTHDCESPEQARAMVIRVSGSLGLFK